MPATGGYGCIHLRAAATTVFVHISAVERAGLSFFVDASARPGRALGGSYCGTAQFFPNLDITPHRYFVSKGYLAVDMFFVLTSIVVLYPKV